MVTLTTTSVIAYAYYQSKVFTILKDWFWEYRQ